MALITALTFSGVVASKARDQRSSDAGLYHYLPLALRPGNFDIGISDVKVIQGVTLADEYAVYIEGRETLIRVFVERSGDAGAPLVTAELCVFNQQGIQVGCLTPTNGPLASASQEAYLPSTLNFSLPIEWTKPGYQYHVWANPDQGLNDANNGNNRFPSQGLKSFNFVTVPPLNVVIVPVEYHPASLGGTYTPQTADMSYLTYLPEKIYPLGEVNYQLHSPIQYAPDDVDQNLTEVAGWINLLGQIAAVQQSESTYGGYQYYGVVNSYDAHGCSDGCIAGMGYIGYPAATGWSGWSSGSFAASETMAHELGHNFGRQHVQCTGAESKPDNDYPYAGGSIGQFGLDVAEKILYAPSQYDDIMSYCDRTWVSDYTYSGVFGYRQTLASQTQSAGAPVDAYLVRGSISPEGEVQLEHLYRLESRLPMDAGGTHTVELLDASGGVLATRSFTPFEIADSGGYLGFSLSVPAEQKINGLRIRDRETVLLEKTADGPLEKEAFEQLEAARLSNEGQPAFSWPQVFSPAGEVKYRLRTSADGGETWQVLALDWSKSSFPVKALPAQGDGLLIEIQASNGINTTTRIFNLQEWR